MIKKERDSYKVLCFHTKTCIIKCIFCRTWYMPCMVSSGLTTYEAGTALTALHQEEGPIPAEQHHSYCLFISQRGPFQDVFYSQPETETCTKKPVRLTPLSSLFNHSVSRGWLSSSADSPSREGRLRPEPRGPPAPAQAAPSRGGHAANASPVRRQRHGGQEQSLQLCRHAGDLRVLRLVGLDQPGEL